MTPGSVDWVVWFFFEIIAFIVFISLGLFGLKISLSPLSDTEHHPVFHRKPSVSVSLHSHGSLQATVQVVGN